MSDFLGDVGISLDLKMGNMQRHIDARLDEKRDEMRHMEQNNMALFAALFVHLGIDTPPFQLHHAEPPQCSFF